MKVLSEECVEKDRGAGVHHMMWGTVGSHCAAAKPREGVRLRSVMCNNAIFVVLMFMLMFSKWIV